MATRAEKIHEMLAAHHAQAEEVHQVAMEGETKGCTRHTFHKTMVEHHAGQKEGHLAEMADCQKAERDQMAKRADQLVPTQVSGVAPERPTPVLRPGQRPIGEHTAVSPDLEKALGLDEANWHVEESSLRQ